MAVRGLDERCSLCMLTSQVNRQVAGSRLIEGQTEMFHTLKPPERVACSQSPLQTRTLDSVFVGH